MRQIYGKKTILKKNNQHKLTKKLIDLILRSHGGVFQKEIRINEFNIAKSLQINSLTVRNELNSLDQLDIIDYKEANSNEELTFLIPREDDRTINRISTSIEKFLNQQIQKSEDLIYFIKNNTICRSIQLSNYFGEKKD